MRPSTMLATGLIGLAGATVACAPARELGVERSPPGPQHVFVITNCATDTVIFSVVPPRVFVRRNTDSVWWHVAGQTVRIVVEPKTSRWPFDDPPHRGNRAAPAMSGPVDPDADIGIPYPYKVTATCQNPDGEEITVVIDPIIIIMF